MAQSSPNSNMTSQLPRVDPPHPAGTASPSGSTTTSETDQSVSACPTTIAYGDGGGHHLPHRVGGGLSGDAIALHTRARVQVAHSGPPRVTQDGPRPPVIGPDPPTATPPRTSSAPHHIHDDANSGLLSRAGGLQSPDTNALLSMMVTMLSKQEHDRELDRKRQEQQQEHDRELDRKRQEQRQEHDRELDRKRQEQQQDMLRRQHEHNCDLEDKREKARARERAEDLQRKERDREQRDHARQLDSERAAERERERDRLLMEAQHETNAGIERLSRNIANSPRLSRRGTPTGTPVPAVDRPKPAPRKTPTKAYHTAPYQAADRHPGHAEPTPPPTTCQCTQNPRVPALPLLIPQPPTQPPGVASMIASVRSVVSVRTSVTGSVILSVTGSAGSVTGSAGSVILSVTGSVGSVTAYSALGSNGYVGL